MDLARIFNGKKFMWDGSVYPDEKGAQDIAQTYKNNGFEIQLFQEETKFFLFTRREVKEIIIDGQVKT